MVEAASEIPEKFFGKYDLDKSENFDEFLAAKGKNFVKFVESYEECIFRCQLVCETNDQVG